MSLEEMSTAVIKYAMECNRSDFDEALFLASVSPHVKQVIAAMDTSVIKSRGVNARPYQDDVTITSLLVISMLSTSAPLCGCSLNGVR
jgi:hypothetical protein